MTKVEFTLPLHPQLGPWPPSANRLYRDIGNGKVQTEAVKRWQACVRDYTWEALRELNRTERRAIEHCPDLSVLFCWRVDRAVWKLDIDNPVKPTLDAVFAALGPKARGSRVADDSRVASITSTRVWVQGPQSVTILLAAPDEPVSVSEAV